MKKVSIVGGGIAGLTAGIYLQQAGFETEIYEKNAIAGGQCTGWEREGFHIDNCIHWLTGSKEGSELNALWKNIGALDEGTELIIQDKFYSANAGEHKITLWRDLERTRRELLELSPEDAPEINKFIDYTRLCENMAIPVAKPFECQPLTIGREQFVRMCIRNYDYEKAFAPEGKCVIQCNFSQSEESFEYWKEISQNSNQNSREKYKQEKLYLAGQIMEQIIRKYPVLSGKIHILDVWTPVTYSRYCNSYHGAYMGFIITKNAKDQRTTGKLKGLTNVMIASQWQMGPGGLPVAAAMGKFSAQRVMKCEKMSIDV